MIQLLKKYAPKIATILKGFFYFHWNTRMKNNAKISPSLNIQKQDCASLVVWFFSQFIFIYYFFMVIFCKKRTELDFLLMDLDTTKHKTYNGKNPKRETIKNIRRWKSSSNLRSPRPPPKISFKEVYHTLYRISFTKNMSFMQTSNINLCKG